MKSLLFGKLHKSDIKVSPRAPARLDSTLLCSTSPSNIATNFWRCTSYTQWLRALRSPLARLTKRRNATYKVTSEKARKSRSPSRAANSSFASRAAKVSARQPRPCVVNHAESNGERLLLRPLRPLRPLRRLRRAGIKKGPGGAQRVLGDVNPRGRAIIDASGELCACLR